MERRRTLGSEVMEMGKEWVELLNESKEVTDQKIVEFSLANAEKHEEYWIYMEVKKHTGSEQCKGNCAIKLNGANIGYFILNADYSQGQNNLSAHVWTKPINLLEYLTTSVSLQYNSVNVRRNGSVGNETGTGKFTLEFPANYTGEIIAKIFGK